MFPIIRNRRLRTTASIRRLVRETTITPDDFLVPLFVVEGKGIKEEIPSMPNYFRLSLDELEKEIKSLWEMGLCGGLLFGKGPLAWLQTFLPVPVHICDPKIHKQLHESFLHVAVPYCLQNHHQKRNCQDFGVG